MVKCLGNIFNLRCLVVFVPETFERKDIFLMDYVPLFQRDKFSSASTHLCCVELLELQVEQHKETSILHK